ncbi:putative non-classical export protein [Cladophialophora carrionii]|uniref:Putative non-classical export protein n=1 Tax=Cladophialophora carrionii TaxID=86049 RepID=A0A1C1CGC4_9EURO|nr:putative non-classical export protein [Cladophialophora carrionii]
MVSRPLNLILRGAQFLFVLIIMSLIGNVIAMATAGNPALINYDMFVAAFAMLSLFYLILIAFNESFTGHPIFPVTIDLLNVIFLFCAAVAMAAELGVHSCSNDV